MVSLWRESAGQDVRFSGALDGGSAPGGRWRHRAPAAVAAVLVTAGALCASSPAGATPRALPAACAAAGSTVTCAYRYTGTAQTFTVPAGVNRITVDVSGAVGGRACGHSGDVGPAARVLVPFDVSAGEVLQVNVGGEGGDTYDSRTHDCVLGKGGFNGGGNGGFPRFSAGGHTPAGGGGGGASDIRRSPFGLAERIVTAGGGGGAGDSGGSGIYGGAGGAAGLTGQRGMFGASGTSSGGGAGGEGATPSRGGSGGRGGGYGAAQGCVGGTGDYGDLGRGGSGGAEIRSCPGGMGGGGGGGVHGGGGGGQGGFANVGGPGIAAGGGGGGGSSAGPAGALTGLSETRGNGEVTITYQAP